ncbi:TetR/AcrR family transcriptional regulator [Nocardioides rubriscoriae]|uniref:TetR/AcrR family transcriptional regulator n=1 Tax=Nocardioides rubriscoriae TaxID=642762 RepID=UPI0011DFCE4D|nr:TetR/AcrR family transcriptional regulator [Nocardioides rubriscoriae]
MPTAPSTARATARAELTRAILDNASTQLAEVGPAALSVRAIARDLGMASSAVYRYFPSRDALLTALLVEAYDDLGAAVEAADAGVRRGDLRGRLRAIARALRSWAIAHPHQYALAYGSPVPGYAAPQDTVGPARRVPLVLISLLGDAQQSGRRPRGPDRVPAAEKAALAPVLAFVDPPLSPAYGVRGLGVWSALFGHVSLELFGHMHRGVLDPEAHFAAVVDQHAVDLGLT